MSIIRRFSWIMLNLIRQLYNNFESMQKIIGTNCFKTHSIVDFNMAFTSNLYIIGQSLDANTLFVILLHLIDNQWMIFALLSLSTKMITNPICDERSQLFANDASIKITNFKEVRSSCTKCRPWVELLICHCIHLLRAFASFSFGLTIWAVKKRSKVASGQHIVAIYAAQACWVTY